MDPICLTEHSECLLGVVGGLVHYYVNKYDGADICLPPFPLYVTSGLEHIGGDQQRVH